MSVINFSDLAYSYEIINSEKLEGARTASKMGPEFLSRTSAFFTPSFESVCNTPMSGINCG